MVVEALIATAAASILSLLSISLIIALSRRYELFEKQSARKLHKEDTPFLGGIGIAFSFLLVMGLVLLVLPSGAQARLSGGNIGWLFVALAVIHVTGVVDDLRNIPAWWKLLFQFAAALIAVFGGGLTDAFSLVRGGGALDVGMVSVPVTVLWIVAITNAVNLIDGMDGLSAGVGIIALLAMGISGVLIDHAPLIVLSFTLAGSLLGFLAYNVPPAKIFMGDGGSLFLGFSLAVFPLLANPAGAPSIPSPALLMLLLIPVADTTSAVVRRLRRRVSLYKADREHIHHKLLDLRLGVGAVLGVIYFFAGIGAAAAVATVVIEGVFGLLPAAATLVVATGATVLLYRGVFEKPSVNEDELPARTSDSAVPGHDLPEAVEIVPFDQHVSGGSNNGSRTRESAERESVEIVDDLGSH